MEAAVQRLRLTWPTQAGAGATAAALQAARRAAEGREAAEAEAEEEVDALEAARALRLAAERAVKEAVAAAVPWQRGAARNSSRGRGAAGAVRRTASRGAAAQQPDLGAVRLDVLWPRCEVGA